MEVPRCESPIECCHGYIWDNLSDEAKYNCLNQSLDEYWNKESKTFHVIEEEEYYEEDIGPLSPCDYTNETQFPLLTPLE